MECDRLQIKKRYNGSTLILKLSKIVIIYVDQHLLVMSHTASCRSVIISVKHYFPFMIVRNVKVLVYVSW
ncbi:CLUMA_CG013834, isoform A [Clunio marinus]|uniref:CLUMA_CG013834, isoform A n=1 Tax=Clunio marinus TaxID=568069 RepID=A0A1J1INA0_9DIPT|nr:CLUMA_CG013834, isoform A [Clunio marinus]